jgi:hypothetical protein
MAWKVGSVHEQSDFIGFNIIDATSQRPIVSKCQTHRRGPTPADRRRQCAMTNQRGAAVGPTAARRRGNITPDTE